MKLDITFKYVVRGVIPPRCRKPRDVVYDDGLAEVEIIELSGDEAPIAIIEQGKDYRDVDGERQYVPVVKTYRWHDGRLWLPWWPAVGHGEVTLSSPGYIEHMLTDRIGRGWRSKEEIEQTIADYAASHVFIDGVAHEPAPEPMLHVVTHHGSWGSRFGPRKHSVWVTADTHRREQDALSEFFRADQWAEAKAEAERIRARMKASFGEEVYDTSSDEGTESPLSVLMPEVLTRDPQAEAKAAEATAHRLNITKAVIGAASHVEEAIKGLNKATELIGDVEEFRLLVDTLNVALTVLQRSPHMRIEPTQE